MGELLADLLKEQAELQRAVFEHPPTDWGEFRARCGVWIGLETSINRIKDILEGDDHDQ